tara:strand:+ start:6083 stop:7120 length:1038 start_codon:yes stop_codon:yes gene_type:complete
MKYIFILVSFFLFACENQAPKTETIEVQENQTIEQESNDDKLDSILSSINKAILNDVSNPDLYLKRAQLYDSINDTKSALEDLDRAFKIDSTKLTTLIAQANFLSKRGKLNLGLRMLEKAQVYHPTDARVYVELSELYLLAKNNEKSLNNADLAIKYDKFNAKAYYLKGYNFLEMGDTARSISSYQTAVEQNPDFLDAFLELGYVFSLKHDAIAIDYLENALRIDPKNKQVLYAKGMFEQEHEMYNEAMKTYKTAIEYHPDFREAHHNLGYIHMYYLKLYRQALPYFTAAIEVDSNYIEAYYNRGYSFELMGDINNAAKDYRKALSIKPDYDLAAKGLSRVTAPL